MSLVGGISRHGNPGNPGIPPGTEIDGGSSPRTWWLVPVLLFGGIFLAGRMRKPAANQK
ncbi:hypothetical protein ES703_85342 [subsurface metagenome]